MDNSKIILTGRCTCCGSTDVYFIENNKKIICKQCNSWTWTEDALQSSWINQIDLPEMRDATPKEQEAINNYIKSISTNTGITFDGSLTSEERLNRRESLKAISKDTGVNIFKEYTDYVEIPEATRINITVSPEEVKDIAALYDDTLPNNIKNNEECSKLIDKLEQLRFFNQRAGRELWGDKSQELQDKDIENTDAILKMAISALSTQQLDAQEAYYKGKIDGIKECTAKLEKVNEELKKGREE